MKNYFVIFCVIAVIFAAGVLTAAQQDSSIETSSQQKTTVKPAKAGNLEKPESITAEPNSASVVKTDSVAATVDGFDIMQSQVEAMAEPELTKMGNQLSPQVKQQLKKQVLEGLIVQHLLDEEVKKRKIVVTEQDVTSEMTRILAKEGLKEKDFEALLQAYGKSLDDYKARLHQGLSYQRLMDAELANKLTISDADANQYYQQHTEQFKYPEQVRASHILISTKVVDPNSDPNQIKAAARTKAEDLLKQIKAGADFAELAKANSACPSKANGGDLGFFSRGKMAKPFEDVAFALKTGQISDVVETIYGYHIIKVTDRKEPGVVTFEHAKADIIRKLTIAKQQEFLQTFIKSLKAKAKIVYPATKDTKNKQAPVENQNPVKTP